MREILFRGKRMKDCVWLYGHYTYSPKSNAHFIHIVDDEGYDYGCGVDPSTVGQYTGLLDRNGKRIFEGDVVITLHQRGDGFCTGEYGFVKFNTNDFCSGFYVMSKLDRISFADAIEVIGNVHDNPGLMVGVTE